MKKIIIALITFFIIGCATKNIPDSSLSPLFPPIPLEDKNKNFNGNGILFEKNIFLSLRPSNETHPIYLKGKKINIIKKYFDKNIVFFKFNSKNTPLFHTIKENVLVGEPIYWFSNSEAKKGNIYGISQNEIFIKGTTNIYSQGSPVFSKNHKLIGILSKSNPQKNIITVQKIKPILNFWEKNK